MKKILMISCLFFLAACTKESPKVSSENLVSLDLASAPLIEVVDSIGIKTFVINVKNVGDEVATNVPVSLSGGQDSAFQLLTSSCPEIQPSVGSCSIRLRFDPKGKANDTYTSNLVIGDLVSPLSVTLNIPPVASDTFDLKVYNQSTEIDYLSLINLGKSSANSLSRVFSIKHSQKKAIASVPVSLIQSTPEFSLNKSVCEKEELNSSTGCQVRLIFKSSSIGIKTAALRVENHDRLNLQAESVPSSLESQSGNSVLSFTQNNLAITDLNFNTVIVPEAKSLVVKIKNTGTGIGAGQLSISPANVFYITGNTCKVISSGSECEFNLRVSSVKKVSGVYNATVNFGSLSLPLSASLIGNDCAVTEHVDPITYQCVENEQLESLANGSRSRNWISTPAPGLWSSWSYSCNQHYENIGEECLGVFYTLTLNKNSGGSVSDGDDLFCDKNCSNQTVSYQYPKTINLNATALISHNLGSFSGDASCAGAVCSVILDGNKSVSYQFDIKQINLTVNDPIGGSLSGAVSGSYDYGTNISVTASSDSGYEFLTFTDDCSGSSCSFSLISDSTVSASFGTIAHSIEINSLVDHLLKNTCSPAFTVVVKDINGNNLNRQASTTINFNSSIQLFSDSGCLNSISSRNLVQQSSTTLYIKGSTIGSQSVGANIGGIIASDSLIIYDSLSITPSSLATIVNGSNQQFSVSGGVGPFSWSKISGAGSISTSGLFSPGLVAGSSTIQVLDTVTNLTAQAVITINSGINITHNCSNVPELVDCTISSTGGVGAKTYIATNGVINSSTGVFYGQCASNLGQSTITATDSSGNSASIELSYPCIYKSCNQIKAESYALTSGRFWLDSDLSRSGLDPYETYCDLSTETGGWDLVAKYGTSSNDTYHLFNTSATSGVATLALNETFTSLTGMQIGTRANNTVTNGGEILVKYNGSLSSFYIVNNLTSDKTRLWGNNPGNVQLGNLKTRPNAGPFTGANFNPGAVVRMHFGSYSSNKGSGLSSNLGSNITLDTLANQASYGQYRLPITGALYNSAATWPLEYNPFLVYVKQIYHKFPRTCLEAKNRGSLNSLGTTASGVYTLDVDGANMGLEPFTAYCDMVTDGGGWTLVSYAGTHSTTKSAVTGSTTSFMPLFHVFGTINANPFTTKPSFSRFDLFKHLANANSRFLARRTSNMDKQISWNLINVSWWGGNVITTTSSSAITPGTAIDLKMTITGNSGWQSKSNAFWTWASSTNSTYPGISWNTTLYANDDNVGSFTTYLSRRSILYWSSEDYVSTYGAQWFHATPLHLDASTGASNTAQDIEFFFRE